MKDIKGYEGLYAIHEDGRVWSYPKKLSRGNKFIGTNIKGAYKSVALVKNKKIEMVNVHRLVAEAFIPNPENLKYINHKDGNKHNNNVSNLEWCTASENGLHAYKVGLSKRSKKLKDKVRTLTVEQVKEIRTRYKPRCKTNSSRALGREFGLSNGCILDIVKYNTYKDIN